MSKRITDSQVLGELGETAIKKIVLETGFLYEQRGRLEAGTDGIVELRDPKSGAPLGKLLGVQVKSTDSGQYIRENDNSFEYLLKPDDLKYWHTSNIPVIIVLWRKSDETAYWKDVSDCVRGEERRLRFDKEADVFDPRCADRIGALTIDRRTPGVFLPPLNQGEDAIINLLRVKLPDEIFISTSPFGSGRDAVPELVKRDNIRFDWVIRKRRFVSFFDPREYGTRAIVDLDQVEAVDTKLIAFNEERDDINDTMDLLRRTVERQTMAQLSFLRKDRLFHFKAVGIGKSRSYRYMSNVNETSAKVVSAYASKKKEGRGYVRHHAARLRFDRLADEWFLVIDPDFYFTTDGFQPHRYPETLLAGKKRLEHNVYWWVDGIYLEARLEDQAQCILVIIGATPEGKKELVGFADGVRESAQSWRDLLLDLKRRSLSTAPQLAVADGALGFWKALGEIWPSTREQRCWVHKTANVLNKLPKSLHGKAKRALQDIWMAETKNDAVAALDAFAESYAPKYTKAVECLTKDREALLAFFDFPAEHWKHLRSTNPIESTFATVRHRTIRSKGCLSNKTALAMVFKLIEAAQKSWRCLDGHNQLPKLITGVKFVDGIEVVARSAAPQAKAA